jgi:ribonuclease P protein component
MAGMSFPDEKAGFSFPKADRILKRSEFLRLTQFGKKIHNKYFIANICPGTTGRTRLGITVTKRVGKAVVRNRIKRLCREYFRLTRHNISGKWDINIVAKQQAAHLSTKQFFLSLQHLFERIRG